MNEEIFRPSSLNEERDVINITGTIMGLITRAFGEDEFIMLRMTLE